MPSITEPSGYVLEPLREGTEFTLYRGRQPGLWRSLVTKGGRYFVLEDPGGANCPRGMCNVEAILVDLQ